MWKIVIENNRQSIKKQLFLIVCKFNHFSKYILVLEIEPLLVVVDSRMGCLLERNHTKIEESWVIFFLLSLDIFDRETNKHVLPKLLTIRSMEIHLCFVVFMFAQSHVVSFLPSNKLNPIKTQGKYIDWNFNPNMNVTTSFGFLRDQ